MVPSITSSFIFMLNHQKTRQLMHPFVTLRSFVAPFTDVDTTESEMRHRWNASKCALVVILRSWSGIACLAEDPIGLPSIVGLLRDTSAPDALKDSILDAFLEVFEPIFSRVKRARGPSRKEDQYYRTLTIATTAKGYSTGRVSSSRKSGPEESTSNTSNKAGNPSMIGMSVGSGSARVLESSKNAASISKLSGNTQTDARQNEISRQSSSESSKSSKSTSGWISSIFGRSTPENTSESDKATNGSKRRQLGSFTELNKNSLIPDRDSPTTKKKRSITKSIAFDVPDSFTNVSKTKYVEHVLYNVLDNYAGLLCVALLHSDILQGLIHLGTRSNLVLAGKARWFFVEFIRVVGHVLPESTCSALLEMPSLIQVTSTNFFGHSSINRKFNAVQLLESFADAFTLAPRSYNSAQPISKNIIPANPYDNGDEQSDQKIRETAADILADINDSDSDDELNAASDKSQIESKDNTENVRNNQNFYKRILQIRKRIKLKDSSFDGLVEATKVNGKEGKEPFRWSWSSIFTLFAEEFQDVNKHLDELMNTKFIRRLCGFYRCSTEEKGYFANLTWEPSNFNYYECAVMLYQRLVNDENGHKFLNSDRRGMVFVEIAAELKNLINIFDKSIPSSSFFSVGKRENAVQYTLSRGYFDLIGVVLKTSGGQKIIDNTDIFGNLCEIGSYPQLDYLSRVAITSLVFSDYGTMSSHIIRHWTSGRGRCSIGLKNYIYNLLGCLLHTRSDEFQEWGIEITVHMMTWETPGNVSRHLTRLLLLVVQKVENLLLFIEKLESVPKRKLDITIDSSYAEILPYFLSVPQGVKYCQSGIGNPIRDGSYLDQIIEDFTVDGEGDTFEKYSRSYERILSKALSPSYVKNILSPSQNIKPIPYLTRDFCSTYSNGTLIPENGIHQETEQIDIEGLLKLPWNIEVKSYKPTDDTVPAGSPEGEYIPVDCFLDPSDLAMPSVSDISTDYNRFVKVRGMVLDDFGMPSGRVIKNERSVASTLMIGLCPVTSDGSMKTSVFQEGSNGENVLSFEQAKRSVTAQLSGTQHPEMNGVRSGDYPPTYLLENLYDWTSCKPYTGKFGVEVFTEIDENYFSIEIPNQPCKFIFSRSKPVTVARNISDESSSNMLYLVEVQYYISVYTGQGHFAKLPCHPLSMLCRTDEGASLLEEKRVIQNLLCFVTEHNPDQDHSVNKLKAVLWNLAHIASSDAGFSAIVSESRVVVAKNPLLNKFSLIEWCIENATTHPNLSLCGTLFSILGLISRSTRGRMILNKFHWSCSSPGSSSAVAIPKYSGDLFKLQTTDPVRSKKTVTELLKEAVASKEKIQTPPELTSKEQEILSLVSKLNGATYDSGHQHLERMKNESPADFSSHSVYVGVMDLFEQHSFSLSDRRFVLSLLPDEARLET
eukprot:GSChrysophyteH1.ASY1.ANO1.2743.1 assembled CDS